MEISPQEIEVVGAHGGRNWYASEGIKENGSGIAINYLADSQDEVDAIAQGLGIAHGVSLHKKAKYVGPSEEYKLIN